MWHQHKKYLRKASKNQTLTFPFSQYLEKITSNLDMLNPLDSFNLMKQCFKHGMKVVLIDMSGTRRSNVDISQVVACEILGVEYKVGDTARINVANKSRIEKKMNVSEGNLIKMNEAIKSYDCHFYSWLENNGGKVAMLYPSLELRRFLVNCQKQRMPSNSSAVLSLEKARRNLLFELQTILKEEEVQVQKGMA